MANRVLETFRRCYSWALSRDYVAATPFTGIERPAPKTRATRTFSNDEIRAIFVCVGGSQLQDLVPLIFHTATRSEETRSMRWSHVDLERAVWQRVKPRPLRISHSTRARWRSSNASGRHSRGMRRSYR